MLSFKDYVKVKNLTGKDVILTPLMKQLTEAALAAELDGHLASIEEANCKKRLEYGLNGTG